jgi:hypothetical protein
MKWLLLLVCVSAAATSSYLALVHGLVRVLSHLIERTTNKSYESAHAQPCPVWAAPPAKARENLSAIFGSESVDHKHKLSSVHR